MITYLGWLSKTKGENYFAEDVRTNIETAFKAGAEAMREEAAKTAEDEGVVSIPPDPHSGYERGMHQTALNIAARVRAIEVR